MPEVVAVSVWPTCAVPDPRLARRRGVGGGGAGGAGPRLRPVAQRFAVLRLHLHRVARARLQSRDRCHRVRRVGGQFGPGARARDPVAHLVADDLGPAGKIRLGPAHIQAVRRARLRRHHRRGRPRRLLRHVGDVHGHRDGGRAAVVVVGLHRHRVARLRLVVVVHARLRLQLSRVRVDVERRRVRPLQAVFERVVFRVRRPHRGADVRARRRVLRHLAVRRSAVDELRRRVGPLVVRHRDPVAVELRAVERSGHLDRAPAVHIAVVRRRDGDLHRGGLRRQQHLVARGVRIRVGRAHAVVGAVDGAPAKGQRDRLPGGEGLAVVDRHRQDGDVLGDIRRRVVIRLRDRHRLGAERQDRPVLLVRDGHRVFHCR